MTKRLTTEQFLEQAVNIRGDLYDYSQVKYETAFTKVKIGCSQHGWFWQTPDAHKAGKGCSKCTGKNKSTSDFIVEAKTVHGDKFNYGKTRYAGAKTKVIITCSIHGDFEVEAHAHLRGCGCSKCYGRDWTKDQFVEASKKIHGDKYCYDNTVFRAKKDFVNVECPAHGEFRQLASSHLKGLGCQKCGIHEKVHNPKNLSGEQKTSFSRFYLIKIYDDNGDYFYKAGYTKRTINDRYYLHRLKGVKYETVIDLECNRYISQSIEIECLKFIGLQGAMYKCHYLRDLSLDGWTECFWPDDKILNEINDIIAKYTI